MQHPFEALQSEYANLLAMMRITRHDEATAVAGKLLVFVKQGRYAEVSAQLGIPQIFIATSFERESSSNFNDSPAQGDPWRNRSVNVPRGRGPFASWKDAALDAYRLDGLDKVGESYWTWPRFCYEGELFNGFGYRGHGVYSPYDWAGSTVYVRSKYTGDGVFDPNAIDHQLGIVPVARLMADEMPELDLLGWPTQRGTPPALPQFPPLGVGGGTDTAWLQTTLNTLLHSGLTVDGSYGRRTRSAVVEFQNKSRLEPDGFAGPLTIAALEKALKEGAV